MRTTTSRRAIPAGAAILPVASLPALAGPALSHPDAELIRLGRKTSACFHHLTRGATAYDQLAFEANNSAIERFEALIPDRAAQAAKGSGDAPLEFIKDAWTANGADVVNAAFEPIEDHFLEVEAKIVKLPATTFEGLRAKLHVAIHTNNKLWEEPMACRSTSSIDLRTLDRHRDAAVTSLIPALSCRSCRPNAPFAELLRLSRTSIADEMRIEHTR